MPITTVSSKYQIVIPLEIRKGLKIKPGDQIAMEFDESGLRVIHLRPLKEMRGFLKGVKNDFERDPDRQF